MTRGAERRCAEFTHHMSFAKPPPKVPKKKTSNALRSRKATLYDTLKDRSTYNHPSNPSTSASTVLNAVVRLALTKAGWPKDYKPSVTLDASGYPYKDEASAKVVVYVGVVMRGQFCVSIRRKTLGDNKWEIGFDVPLYDFDPENPKTILEFRKALEQKLVEP